MWHAAPAPARGQILLCVVTHIHTHTTEIHCQTHTPHTNTVSSIQLLYFPILFAIRLCLNGVCRRRFLAFPGRSPEDSNQTLETKALNKIFENEDCTQMNHSAIKSTKNEVLETQSTTQTIAVEHWYLAIAKVWVHIYIYIYIYLYYIIYVNQLAETKPQTQHTCSSKLTL